jgi:hypothetical protein
VNAAGDSDEAPAGIHETGAMSAVCDSIIDQQTKYHVASVPCAVADYFTDLARPRTGVLDSFLKRTAVSACVSH